MAVITINDIAAAVVLQIDQGVSSKKIASQLARYLAAERRSGELEAILRSVRNLRSEHADILEANITSAFPLNPSTRRQLADLLPAKNVIMHETIDPEVIGGVRVEADGMLLNATIQRQLEAVKQGVN